MSHHKSTIIGIFDSLDVAERARDQVRDAGVGTMDVRVISPDDVRHGGSGHAGGSERTVGDRISDVVSSLIGHSDEGKVGEYYLDRARHGASLLVVDVDSEDETGMRRVRGIVETARAREVRDHRRDGDGVTTRPESRSRESSDTTAADSRERPTSGERHDTAGPA